MALDEAFGAGFFNLHLVAASEFLAWTVLLVGAAGPVLVLRTINLAEGFGA